MKVLFVAGFGPIIRDTKKSTSVYINDLKLSLKDENGYYSTEKLEGVKHFSLWSLSHVAKECFGSIDWPKEIPIPQAWLEFDVVDIKSATEELTRKWYKLLVSAKKQPWGQTVTRFLSPEGLLLSITYTPWLRKDK